MLFGKTAVIKPPADRSTRQPAQYSSGLTPEILGELFDRSDRGELGPLNELGMDIWGKDPFVGGLIGDRLAACSEVDLIVLPNERDPDQGRAFELAQFYESWIYDLKAYKCRPNITQPRSEGGLSAVLELLSIPWYTGMGIYWRMWDTPVGMPRPLPSGIELLDPTRYRTARNGDTQAETGFYLETEEMILGRDIYEYPSQYWCVSTASRAGQRIALSGVNRSIAFWWWLRITGTFAISKILDKFGVPNIVGESNGAGAGSWDATEQGKLDEFLQNYHSDVAACFPAGYKINIVNMQPGSDQVAQTVMMLAKSAIMYGVLGNEVSTSAQGAASSAGVAGGAGTVAERVEKRLVLQDRRRAVDVLDDTGAHATLAYYGAQNCRYLPQISLVDISLTTRPLQGSNPAPAAQATTGPTR